MVMTVDDGGVEYDDEVEVVCEAKITRCRMLAGARAALA